MEFPAYTDDAYWTDVIEQYIQNDNNHPGWYNIEYYMWEYFKDCLKRSNRFFFEHPLLPVLKSEFDRNACVLSQGTEIYRARIDRDSKLWNEWNDYCSIESTPKRLNDLEKRDVPADKLAELWTGYEEFVNSEKTKEIKQRIESGFQGLMLLEVLHLQGEQQAQADVILRGYPICMLLWKNIPLSLEYGLLSGMLSAFPSINRLEICTW